jgi:hypothetical protein
MKRALFAILAVFTWAAHSQEFKPHPHAHITAQEWQAYFDQVKARHARTERPFPNEHLVLFDDAATRMTWTFTTPGHPAHPAWITRQPVEDLGQVKIRQIGFYAGDEAEFTKLFKTYLAMTEVMRRQIERSPSPKPP